MQHLLQGNLQRCCLLFNAMADGVLKNVFVINNTSSITHFYSYLLVFSVSDYGQTSSYATHLSQVRSLSGVNQLSAGSSICKEETGRCPKTKERRSRRGRQNADWPQWPHPSKRMLGISPYIWNFFRFLKDTYVIIEGADDEESYTIQYRGCGDPGRFIHMIPNYG